MLAGLARARGARPQTSLADGLAIPTTSPGATPLSTRHTRGRMHPHVSLRTPGPFGGRGESHVRGRDRSDHL